MSFPFRAEALLRDGGCCVNCGDPATDVHHIVPRSRGGRDVLSNLASLCITCHGLVHGDSMVRFRRLQEEGRQRARAAGVRFGRKKTYTPEQAEQARLLSAQGVSQRGVARRLGLSNTMVRRMLADDTPAPALAVAPVALPEPDWLDLVLADLAAEKAAA